MASVHIKRRAIKSGFRFIVRYRLGGRRAPLLHAGSFRSIEDARAQRDWLLSQIAAGQVPDRQVLQRQPEPVLVYFAQLGDLIKIGVSIAPERRARALSAQLLHVEPGGRERERELHNAFQHARLSGEWFRNDERIQRYLAKSGAATSADPSPHKERAQSVA